MDEFAELVNKSEKHPHLGGPQPHPDHNIDLVETSGIQGWIITVVN